MRQGFVGPWSRSLGLLAGVCLLGACDAPEQGSGSTGPLEAKGGGGSFWSQGSQPQPSQPKAQRQGLVSGPDFAVTRVSGPAAVAPYGAYSVDVTACNLGDSSEFTELRVYQSADGTITPEDRTVGAATVLLNAGACVPVRMSIQDAGGEGTWVLGAIVDPLQAFVEASEDNNALAGGSLRVTSIPDLVVSQVRGPAAARPYSPFPVTVATCNTGTAVSPGVPVRVFLSDDATITPADRPIGDVFPPSLPPGECFAQEVQVGSMEAGPRFLGAIADPGDSLVEAAEDNNALSGTQIIIGDGPDLVLRGFSAPPNIRPSEPFVVHAEVCNQGTAPSATFALSVAYSLDDIIGPGGDGPVGQSSTSESLLPGACRKVAINGRIQAPAGVYFIGGQVFPNGGPLELREDNHLLAGPRIGVGDAPDLVVSAVSGPPNLYTGSFGGPSVVTVCNQGTRESPSAAVDLYLSHDATITSEDTLAGSTVVPPLTPGACAARTAHIQIVGYNEVVYYLGAIVDREQSLPELREDNNALMGHRFALAYLPDFVVKEVSSPTRATPGGPVEVAVTVCNEGPQASPSLPIAVVRSADAEIGRADPVLGSLELPPLQQGECIVQRGTVPMSGPEGKAYLGALVDVPNAVRESFEDNNALAGNRLDVGHAPDLVVSVVRGPPSVEPGLTFTTRVTVCNEGTQPSAPSPVTLFLSRDADVTPSDLSLNGAQVPSLPQGRCHTQDLPASANWAQGLYTLGAIVDGPSNPNVELREDNNAASGGELVVASAPDYTVTAVGGPGGVFPGQSLSIPVTVCNQGTVSGPPSPVDVFLAMGAQSSAMDRRVGGASTPPLSAGQCVTVSVSSTIPFQPGTFTLGAVVDKQGSLPEPNEGNNVRMGRRIGVGSAPDLVVRDVSGPTVVQPGGSFPLGFTVCNEGSEPVPSGAASVEFVHSADTSINFQDVPLTSVSLPGLVPGQCLTQSVVTQHYGPQGPRSLGAIVDRHDGASELFEDNNFVAGSPLLVGNAPDLVITALTVQPSGVTPGAPVSGQVTVCNQGNVPSSMEDVGLFQSGDALLNPEDLLLKEALLPSLAPGACATLSLAGVASGPSGVYTVGAIADPWRKLAEAREDNNTFSGAPVAGTTTMDLRVSVAGAPGLVRPGASFSPEVMVCNGGVVRARGVYAELYLSLDEVRDGGDYFAGGMGLPELAPGQCLTVPLKASAQAPEGHYRLLGWTDSQDPEERKDNNVFVGGALTVSTRPVDLTVTAVTVPLNVSPTTTFPVTVRVCNQGTSSSPTTRLELLASPDATITRGTDSRVADVTFSSLSPGACRDMTVSGRANVTGGMVWMGALVDSLNSILEANEANNLLASEPMRVGSGPDLLVASVQSPVRAVAPATGFSTTVQVCNRGTASLNTSARMEVFLSSDPLISEGDFLWTTRSVPMLSADACTNVSVSGSISGLAAGTWFIGVRLDHPSAITELREDNNVHASAQVVVGTGPNLVIAEVRGPSAARQGALFNLEAQVCNQGTQPSPSTDLRFHLSGDAVINPEDAVLFERTLAGLGAGSCVWVPTSVSYGGAPEGALFTVGAIIDPRGVVTELREDDNAKAGPRLQFDNRPPSAPSLTSTSPNVSGNTTTPVLFGGTEAGATVHIYTDSACTGAVVGSATGSSTSGSFSVSVTAQANATTTFYARATDAAGNVSSCSVGRGYTHDGVAPTVPVLTGTNPVSPGTSTQPAFQGTAEPGATVRLYTTSTCTGTVAASGTVGTTGAFSLLVTVAANATTTVYAAATDAVGNVSACSTGLDYTHQDPAPITP
jgi:subtilase family serine protease